jgi:hypothetical protein
VVIMGFFVNAIIGLIIIPEAGGGYMWVTHAEHSTIVVVTGIYIESASDYKNYTPTVHDICLGVFFWSIFRCN